MNAALLIAGWVGLCAWMGWFYLRTPDRSKNRRTHRLAKYLSVSPSLTRL